MAAPFAVEDRGHVVLRCIDQPRMLRFYVEVLGLVEERRLDAIGLIQLRAGRSLVDLVPNGGAAPAAEPNMDHLCLAVAAPDMDAVVSYLTAAGVETIGEPMVRDGARGYGLSIYCRDPEGNVVELKRSEASVTAARAPSSGPFGLSCRGAVVMGDGLRRSDARVAELADARDLGSRGQPWGFESPLSHCERDRDHVD